MLLALDDELIEEIDTYRYANRIPTRSDAMRKLLRRGLDAAINDPVKGKKSSHLSNDNKKRKP